LKPAAIPAWVRTVRAALQPLADPARAAGMAAYMKERFPFLGVQTPDRRAALKPLMRDFRGDPVAAAQILWQEPEREFQYVACDLLRTQAEELSPAQLPALEALVTAKSWWDTVDGLAQTMGLLVLRERKLIARMDQLIRDENLWLRRVALLHQLGWKSETDQERLFRYCLLCAPEREFFIRKAIGWALRQYARTAPDTVRAFLLAHQGVLSALTIREAGKHLGLAG
jgi:3-methyladenine DNA glycosylase AlkD